MSSIPLPAMHIDPVQVPDMVGNYERILRIKNMMQNAPLQQQAMQQQVQSGQLDIQQKQIAAKDAQIMQGVMQQWGQPKTTPASTSALPQAALPSSATPASSSMPNYDDLLDMARKAGVSYSTYQGLQKNVLDMKEKASTIAKDDAQTGASNANAMKTKNGMIVDAMSGVMNLPDDQLAPGLLSAAQELAGKGLLDPQHIQMAQQMAQSGNPAAIRQQLDLYTKSLGGFSQILSDAQKKLDVQKKQGESDPNSPFYAPSASSVAMGTAPGAAQIQAGEVKQAATKAGAEAAARQPYELGLARAKQVIQDGDPISAAQLLVNGDVAPSQLISSRKPEFAQKAFQAAHDLSGGTWNAQSAEGNFKVASSPTNVAFFGSAKSLTDKGGTLDQLANAGKDIPQKQIPALNSIADWEQAATGSGPIAKYASLALGVADDYAKVMGGGQGSDTARTQALQLIKANLSPEGRAGSLEGIRGAVQSQTNSRIGNNPVLQRMYSGGGTGNQQPIAPTPQTHTFSVSAWQAANPRGDANAARAAAQRQGYQVVQ